MVTQPHVTPWSTVLRVPTDDGPYWFKASGPGPAHEGPLLEVMRRHAAPHVLQPVAVDHARAWQLFQDGGATLRQTRDDGRGDLDLAAWERILVEYASVQRSLEAVPDELLAAGVPDSRPAAAPGILAGLLERDDVWRRVPAADREATDAARERLRALMPAVAALAGELGGSGIAATVQHDDLHGGNILVGPAGDRFFDWGDAILAHPFGTLTVTLGSIGYYGGFELEGPELARLRDIYTEAWTDVVPRTAMARLARLAIDLGHIARAASWDRAMWGLSPDDMEEDGGATAEWLMDLIPRLEPISR